MHRVKAVFKIDSVDLIRSINFRVFGKIVHSKLIFFLNSRSKCITIDIRKDHWFSLGVVSGSPVVDRISGLVVGINNGGIVFLEQASWSGRCILGCLFRPAEVNRSNRNWHADAPRSPETVANSDLRKTQPLGNDNGSRPWPLSSFSQDQRVGRSFCSRSFNKKWREIPFLYFSLFIFSIYFFLFQSGLPSRYAKLLSSDENFSRKKIESKLYIREPEN